MKLVYDDGMEAREGDGVVVSGGAATIILISYPVVQVMFTDAEGAQTGTECTAADIGAQWYD